MAKQPGNSYIKRIYAGRLNRTNYIKGTLFVLLPFLTTFLIYWMSEIAKVIFSAQIVDEAGTVVSTGAGFDGVSPMIITLLGLAAFTFLAIVEPSLVIRRHHDMNQSWKYPISILAGLLVLTLMNGMFASLVGSIYTLYLLLWKGNRGENKFGEPDDTRGVLRVVGLKV